MQQAGLPVTWSPQTVRARSEGPQPGRRRLLPFNHNCLKHHHIVQRRKRSQQPAPPVDLEWLPIDGANHASRCSSKSRRRRVASGPASTL